MPNGLYFPAVVFSLFLFSTLNFWGHWTDLNQTWTHIHLWLLFKTIGPNSPGRLPLPPWAGAKKTLFETDFDQKYLCNGTWYQQSERNLSIYRESPKRPPQIWGTLVHRRLRTVGEFFPPPKFLGTGVPALPHGRCITDNRQTLARVT